MIGYFRHAIGSLLVRLAYVLIGVGSVSDVHGTIGDALRPADVVQWTDHLRNNYEP